MHTVRRRGKTVEDSERVGVGGGEGESLFKELKRETKGVGRHQQLATMIAAHLTLGLRSP